MSTFSWQRTFAIMRKEFRQMRRNGSTIAILLMIPLMQLLLFGYAINNNPRHLPTMIISADHTPMTRELIVKLENSSYFNVVNSNATEAEAHYALQVGTINFALFIPANFTHDLIHGDHPTVLMEADATDSVAIGQAVLALNGLAENALNFMLQHGFHYLLPKSAPYQIIVHAKYNPEAITQFNIVPGLMGVILTMTMVMVTALSITREREVNTMEMLLATPVQPLEVMLGKLSPYIFVGYTQQLLTILLAILLFHVPFSGSFTLLILLTLPFIVANLTVGLLFSIIAKNQLEAMYMTFFFFLPSILLSGFMFPFHGMPKWAEYLGNCLPLTHFLQIVRGILLKGNTFMTIWPNVWPILLFMGILLIGSVKFYRKTLD